MHDSYREWLDNECPEVYCQCSCHGEIIIKNHHKVYGIPKYINGHQHKCHGKIHYNKVKLGIKI